MKIKKLTKDVRKPTKYLICTMDIDKSKVKTVDNTIFIEGYANTVDKDRVGDVVLPDAFTKTLPTYMDNPVLLFQHDWDKVIGTVTSAEVTDKGLYIRAKVSAAKDVEDVRTKILEGSLRTFSIGYNEVDAVFDERTKTNVIKELELLEISVVTIPANANAKFGVVEGEKSEDEKMVDGLSEGFMGYLAHVIKDLNEDEEITGEFISSLQSIYNEFNGQPPMDVKVERGEGESLGDCVARAIPILMNEGKEQDQAIAIAYSMCEKKAPKTEEKDGEKTKAYTQPEQDHLQKVMESACKSADACMKALQKAHGEHCKEFGSKAGCEAHMKAMDAYCRSMDEANRATKAYKDSMAKDDKAQNEQGSSIVEWHSYSRVGTDDDQYEEDKGGPGSGGARPGAGRPRGSGGDHSDPAAEGEAAAKVDAKVGETLKQARSSISSSDELIARAEGLLDPKDGDVEKLKAANKKLKDAVSDLETEHRAYGEGLNEEKDVMFANDTVNHFAKLVDRQSSKVDSKLEDA